MKYIFPFLYILSIVSYFLIGQIQVPGLPINLNILSILLLFVACFVEERPKIDKWMGMYLVFLFFYALSSILTGYWAQFFHRIYSTFFMSYVIYWATGILIRHYGNLAPLFYPLVVIGILDAVVTVLQANGIPISNPLLMTLIENTDQEDILAAMDYELGYAISGLYISSVFNGHFLLLFFLVSLVPQYKGLNIKMLVFPIAIFVGILFCQQRSAFLLSSLAFIYVLYKAINKKSNFSFLYVAVFLVLIFYIATFLIDYITSSGSRLSETSSTGRIETWNHALDFIFNNIFVGGYDLFHQESGTNPHNLVLSAFIAGGLFGGIALIGLIIWQLSFIWRKIRYSKSLLYCIVGAMYFCLLMDSMFHNTGLTEMDFSTFIIWALFSSVMVYGITPRISLKPHNRIR